MINVGDGLGIAILNKNICWFLRKLRKQLFLMNLVNLRSGMFILNVIKKMQKKKEKFHQII